MATQVQAVQLNMFQTVNDHVDINLAVFSVIPGFKERYDKFTAYLGQLFELNKEVTTDGSGISEKQKQNWTKLIENAFSISSKLKAYALSAGDQTLMSEVNFSKTDLKSSTYQNLVSHGELIENRASALISKLATCNITQIMLDDLKALLAECRKSIPAVRENINKKSTSGISMSQLIKTNQLLLEEMDTLVEVIHESNATIYTGYKKARKSVALPTRHSSVIGKITSAGGTVPMKGATITFYLNGDTTKTAAAANGTAVSEKPVLVKTSAKQGGFMVSSLPEGMYRVEIKKPGFQVKTLTIAVSSTDTAKFAVDLESIV